MKKEIEIALFRGEEDYKSSRSEQEIKGYEKQIDTLNEKVLNMEREKL